MKVFLMHRDRDFDANQPLPWNHGALTQDLELTTLLQAMARRDEFIYAVCRQALFTSLTDPDAIRYRQDVLRDCLKNSDVVREIYRLPIEAIERKRAGWLGIFSKYPTGILSSAVQMLTMFVELLKRLRRIADEHAANFESEGFRRFFTMIANELDDEYFAIVDSHLKTLRFRDGVVLSAALGRGNEGADYILCKPPQKKDLVRRLLASRAPSYSFTIDPRDDAGARALGDLRDRGLNLVANAVAQSADHVDSFFAMLRLELAFYMGCLNLYEQLMEMGEPITFPVPTDTHERRHSFRGLYDICLALTMKQKVVGNDVNADNKDLVIITGANQGGKSTFLRSIGIAQLMMQCGMFVPAESFCANTCTGVYTHYKREEDKTLKSGKLDEELGRMSTIIDHIAHDALVLFNESFSATNEREGSEIARQIVSALVEKHVKVYFVTHQYEFAHSMTDRSRDGAAFLRAERLPDGTRTFKLVTGEPLQTSYGKDLYDAVFGNGSQAATPDQLEGADEG